MAEIFRRGVDQDGPEFTIVCSQEEAEVLHDLLAQTPARGHPGLAWRLALGEALGIPEGRSSLYPVTDAPTPNLGGPRVE